MKRIALVYGYGQLANGELDEQTIGRCKKAPKLYCLMIVTFAARKLKTFTAPA